MEQFDFNLPITSAVIFDDSDDDTKLYIDDSPVQEQATKVKPVEVVRCHVDEVRHFPSKTETLQSNNVVQNDLENTRNEVVKNNKTTAKTLRNVRNSRKSLDMPSLEENITTQNANSSINERNNVYNQETDLRTKTESEAIKTIKNSTSDKKIHKRRLSKDSNLNVNTKKAKNRVTKQIEHGLPNSNTNKTNQNVTQDYNQSNNMIRQQILTNPNINTNRTEIQEQRSYEQNSHTIKPNTSVQECNKSLSNGGFLLTQSHKDNNDPTNHVEYRINIEINKNYTQDCEQLNSDPSVKELSDEINKEVTSYLKESLNTVSEHMIHIIHLYQIYMRIYQSKSERSVIEQAKYMFIRNKHHFFDLSYSTVVNIIIPREDDVAFVKNFLSETIKLAQSQSYAFTILHMEPLLIEMISWVKRRKAHIQSMNLNKQTNPTLLRQLQQGVTSPQNKPSAPVVPPPPYPFLENPLQKSSKETNVDCVHPSRPQGRNSNVEAMFSNNQNRHGQPCCSAEKPCGITTVMPPQNTQNIREYYDNHTYSQPQKTTSYNLSLQSLHNQVQMISPQVISNVHNVDSTWLVQTTPSWPQATPSWQKNVTMPWQKDAPLAQSYPEYQNQQDLTPDRQQRDNPAQIMNHNEPARSSISRDSGFISPLNFNSSNDQLYNLQEDQRSPPTPLITHVTSLNPNASYIMDGECTVCGKTTKKKCLGCFTCYYCSHGCQSMDWKNHMPYCLIRKVSDGKQRP